MMVWFENPLALALIPVAGAALYYLLVRRPDDEATRRRYAVLGSRIVIVALLLLVVAQPFVVETTVVQGEDRVHMLVDNSDSMEVFRNVSQELAADIEEEGIQVDVTQVASERSSRLGDAVLANVRRDENVLLVSDGRTTGGRSLEGAAEALNGIGVTINAVNLTPTDVEAYVGIEGPSKASRGVKETFKVRAGGVNYDSAEVSVSVDGETVATRDIAAGETAEVSYSFDSVGEHEITATLSGVSDGFDVNDKFRKTVRVVKRPRILYVSPNNYPFRQLLNQLYRVDTARDVPSDLSGYYTVVLQNVPASRVGDVGALQEFVIDGGGLVVAGGPNAYDGGGYSGSTIGDMVPVRSGESGRTGDIVLLVDVSGSRGGGEEGYLPRVRGVALDVIESLGGNNRVGLVVFTDRLNTGTVVPLGQLSSNRGDLKTAIRRINSDRLRPPQDRGTNIVAGLQAAEDELSGPGEIIVISDGLLYGSPPERGQLNPKGADVARRLNSEGIRIYTVGIGVGVTDHEVMRQLAEIGGGQYYRADSTDKLRVQFGGKGKTPQGNKLTIMDSNHFITQGVETSIDLPTANKVTVKDTGDFLVATGNGQPAMASGRYGLGRVVSVTAHVGNGVLGGLLSRPDSALLSRGVNWAIGDPERLRTDIAEAEDTRVGEPAEITYKGSSPPSVEGVKFRQRGKNEYVATVTPDETGFVNVGSATKYAVNYPEEYGGFGLSGELVRSVGYSGGKIYEPTEGERIAQEVRAAAREPRETRRELGWIALAVAILLYLTEVCVRRLHDVYGYGIGDVRDIVRS